MLSPDELERYARHIVLRDVGGPGQAALKRASVLVIGAGGLGAPALMYRAAAGVGTLGVVDDDVVSLSNLQRQVIHTTPDIGRHKVESAAERISALNPHVRFVGQATWLNADNALALIGDYDLVLDGSDNFSTRYLASDACFFAKRPLITAALGTCDGSLTTIRAHEKNEQGEFNPTYRCLFPEAPPPGTVPACAEAGVMGALAGVMGSMMALEAIREIVGFGDGLVGRLLMIDARAMRFETLRYARDPANPLNGDGPVITDLSAHRPCSQPLRRGRLLAVEMRHLLGRVTRTGGDIGREGLCQHREMSWRQRDLGRTKCLAEAVAGAGADQRHDLLALRRHPGDRDLCRRCANLGGDGAQLLHQCEIGIEIRSLEARRHQPVVLACLAGVLRPMAADEPARQHTIGGDADAELAAGPQDVAFDATLDQRIFDLEICDRVHGVRAADGVGADLGQADMFDVAGLHEIGDAADGFLDRNVGIEPRRGENA